jgi:hypothetical protein
MNNVTRNLITIYQERFKNDKSYLEEKLEILENHKNKLDGLSFLINADTDTQKMYTQKTDLTIEEISQLKEMWHKL